MAPLDPSWLARAGRGELIEDDRDCAKCGYSVLGLRTTGLCPECAHPIAETTPPYEPWGVRLGGTVLRDCGTLMDAPPPYLARLAGACATLTLGGFALAAGTVCAALVELRIGAGVALLGSFAWAHGTVQATSPRPLPASAKIDACAEWASLRRATRITQHAWFVAFTLLLAGAFAAPYLSPAPTPVVRTFVLAPALLGALGLAPLCLYLANLAFWAGHSGLGASLRVCATTLPLALVPGAPLLLTGWLGPALLRWPTLQDPGSWIRAAVGAALLLPFAFLLACVWEVGQFGRWIGRHRAEAEERDGRRRAPRGAPAHRRTGARRP